MLKFEKKWKQGDQPESGSAFHSSFYHRYFEGYTEAKVQGKNGRKKIMRVYTGQYYSQNLSDRKWKENKIFFLFLYLTAVVLFIFFAAINKDNNKIWFTELSETLVFLAFFWMLYVILNYLAAPRNMTINQYRSSSVMLIKSGKVATIAAWFAAVMQIVYVCLPESTDKRYGMICAIAYGFSGLAVWYLTVLESKMKYKKILSEGSEMNGFEIQR